ncbi:hypothetical protein DH2020_042542 [Rehmannia glutinosa]|uniref:Protein kinase domain-containing protein n=1 Tax=Rehmannia glutinosa TaxID=99300 RepID=A0ABR0UMA7_REHGL
MEISRFFVSLCISWSFLIWGTHQLQSSQTQVLFQLRKQLEYPKQLDNLLNPGIDLCFLSSLQINITCQDSIVTEIRIFGDMHTRLSQNFSMDSLVATLSRLNSLRVLSLVSLGIWGPIPDKIHRLQSLEYLDLSWNFLYGSIPHTVSRIVNLQILKMDGNFLNGTFPDWFDSFSNLTSLSLRNNMFSGPLPSSIQRITSLTDINLSNNKISGKLLDLSSLSRLRWLDLSNNKLDSGLPRHQHPETYCVVNSREEGIAWEECGDINRGTSEQHLLQKAVHENSVTGFTAEILTNARFISEAAKLGSQGAPAHRQFSLDELKAATNNFDKFTLLGEGSTGKIYKGRLENGAHVAIRCLTVSRRFTIRNLKLRLDLLAKLRHPHLVCLLGHCIESEVKDEYGANKVYLIYEYVPNGNYRAHLSETNSEKVLKWSDRLAVLIGIAKAVHFLHTGIIPGFYSNRLKANNILLNEHRMGKLSDYGLSVVAQDIDKDKVSLGNPDGQRRIVDPTVLASCSQESLSIVVSLTINCISPESSTRPSFEDILWNLQYAAQVQATSDDQRSGKTLLSP